MLMKCPLKKDKALNISEMVRHRAICQPNLILRDDYNAVRKSSIAQI